MLSKSFSVAVMVSDGKKAAKWYKEKLGFNVSTEMEHWVTAWPQGSDLEAPPLRRQARAWKYGNLFLY